MTDPGDIWRVGYGKLDSRQDSSLEGAIANCSEAVLGIEPDSDIPRRDLRQRSKQAYFRKDNNIVGRKMLAGIFK